MEIVKGGYFEGELVELDGRHFIDCTFTDCILKYSGGDVRFDTSTMSACRHVFYGRARATLHYLQRVGLMEHVPTEWGEFPEQVH